MNVKSNEGSLLIYEGPNLLGSIPFGAQRVSLYSDGVRLSVLSSSTTYDLPSDTEVDSISFSNKEELAEKLSSFKKGGGSVSDGAVESVTGNLVNNSDPANPIVNLPTDVLKDSDTSTTPSAGKIPVYSSQGELNVGMPTSVQNAIPLSFFNSILSETPEASKVPVYSQQGLLSTGTPEFPENAVSLAYLDLRIPMPNASGSFILKSVDGVVSWVAE